MQNFSFKVCFGLWIRNFKVQRSNTVLAIQKSVGRIGPLRNGRKLIFVTILLPEFISDKVVRLAFSNFREVASVFKGRHEFNRKIRNDKRHVKIFPVGGEPPILSRKISFHGRIQSDVLFGEKEVLCYKYKTQHMLGENCPVATPTAEDSGMSLNEQSNTPGKNLAPVRPESSVEAQPSAGSGFWFNNSMFNSMFDELKE